MSSWDTKYFELIGTERNILGDWGLFNGGVSIQYDQNSPLFKPSPDCWNPPPKGFLKLNFDGASKGNPGKVGYGFILRNNKGKMLGYGYGFLGIESGNAGEIEGLIQGL